MRTRLVAAGLWFLAALYAGSTLHGITGLHDLVGPVIGLMSAILIVADPFRRLARGHDPAALALPAPIEPNEMASRLSEAA
jgi:hypothetical protein